MARIGETMRARCGHVDMEARVWTIPAENSKNGREHIIYLSDFAAATFVHLRENRFSHDWVFPAMNVPDAVCTKSVQKQIRDRQRDKPIANSTTATGTLALRSGPWTAHDLRRSGSTLVGDLGVRPDIIERCLNHAETSYVARIYQRQSLRDEQAKAWQTLGVRLDLLSRK